MNTRKASEAEAIAHVAELGRRARHAARILATSSNEVRSRALRVAAEALRSAVPELLKANEEDVAAASEQHNASFLERLRLTEERIMAMAAAVVLISDMPDPMGRVLANSRRPNGLHIERVSVPIGVIGMIYESRPNVGIDASALCIKSGNAIILRAGSESRRSTEIIVEVMRTGLAAADLPEDAVQAIALPGRDAVTALLQADKYIDLVIPRGGRALVELVRDQASVPTLLHLDGNCHTYVHEAADLAMAEEVIYNAKLRRPGICGATESIVVDRAIASAFIPRLVARLSGSCEVRGDAAATAIAPTIEHATQDDWGKEYLEPIVSLKIVDDLDEAISWVTKYSSGHTDAIITADTAAALRFMQAIDSAIVMHNASTQFADGGEFGMGAEIGIATGKLHARGPVGLEQLCSYKYLVHGDGQVRG